MNDTKKTIVLRPYGNFTASFDDIYDNMGYRDIALPLMHIGFYVDYNHLSFPIIKQFFNSEIDITEFKKKLLSFQYSLNNGRFIDSEGVFTDKTFDGNIHPSEADYNIIISDDMENYYQSEKKFYNSMITDGEIKFDYYVERMLHKKVNCIKIADKIYYNILNIGKINAGKMGTSTYKFEYYESSDIDSQEKHTMIVTGITTIYVIFKDKTIDEIDRLLYNQCSTERPRHGVCQL